MYVLFMVTAVLLVACLACLRVTIRLLKEALQRLETVGKITKYRVEQMEAMTHRKFDDEAQWIREQLLHAEGVVDRAFQTGLTDLRTDLFVKGSDFNVRRLDGTYQERLRVERLRRGLGK